MDGATGLKNPAALPIQRLQELPYPYALMSSPDQASPFAQESESLEERDDRLRRIILACDSIPEPVALAEFARVDERRFDETLFRILTNRYPGMQSGTTNKAVLERRSDALYPYVGRRLACILITLPGARYTIEIDPSDEKVVYWEWHGA